MKTMTCRQLGGPCDVEHPGATADEVIKAQDRHLKQAIGAGDPAHEPAHADMKGRWRRSPWAGTAASSRSSPTCPTTHTTLPRPSDDGTQVPGLLDGEPSHHHQIGSAPSWRGSQ